MERIVGGKAKVEGQCLGGQDEGVTMEDRDMFSKNDEMLSRID